MQLRQEIHEFHWKITWIERHGKDAAPDDVTRHTRRGNYRHYSQLAQGWHHAGQAASNSDHWIAGSDEIATYASCAAIE